MRAQGAVSACGVTALVGALLLLLAPRAARAQTDAGVSDASPDDVAAPPDLSAAATGAAPAPGGLVIAPTTTAPAPTAPRAVSPPTVLAPIAVVVSPPVSTVLEPYVPIERSYRNVVAAANLVPVVGAGISIGLAVAGPPSGTPVSPLLTVLPLALDGVVYLTTSIAWWLTGPVANAARQLRRRDLSPGARSAALAQAVATLGPAAASWRNSGGINIAIGLLGVLGGGATLAVGAALGGPSLSSVLVPYSVMLLFQGAAALTTGGVLLSRNVPEEALRALQAGLAAPGAPRVLMAVRGGPFVAPIAQGALAGIVGAF